MLYKICKYLPVAKNFTVTDCSFSEDMEEKLMVTDIYEILIAIVSSTEGSIAVEHAGTVTALCHVAMNRSYGM